jgi:hypothetical protein
MRRLLLILAVTIIQITAFAQHQIHFKIKGLRNVTVYLGFYADDKPLFTDTASVNHKGDITFEGNETLTEGLYFLALEQVKLFDFVIGENQYFDMETSPEDYLKNMKVVNDEDNIIFFESLVFNMQLHKEAEPLLKIVSDNNVSEDKKRSAQMALNKIKMLSNTYQDDVIENYPDTVTARLFKSSRTVTLSSAQSKTDSVHSASHQEWYQSHFDLF